METMKCHRFHITQARDPKQVRKILARGMPGEEAEKEIQERKPGDEARIGVDSRIQKDPERIQRGIQERNPGLESRKGIQRASGQGSAAALAVGGGRRGAEKSKKNYFFKGKMARATFPLQSRSIFFEKMHAAAATATFSVDAASGMLAPSRVSKLIPA